MLNRLKYSARLKPNLCVYFMVFCEYPELGIWYLSAHKAMDALMASATEFRKLGGKSNSMYT